ncbi:glycoside hydrolase family 19 protein [Dyella sp.]|uniref:glycoside hydrolase family 19 protein n=1 Tax=Dyella sp. TaxID=1869338 RepID=UPI002FDB0191
MDVETFRLVTGVPAARAAEWAPHVSAAMDEFQIDTFPRVAAFLAQTGHESGGFVYTKEIWGPTAAQSRYEGRADLGNTVKGDGYLFRGRGLIQITGRLNYMQAAKGLGLDLLHHPELLEQPVNAARSAAWWWKTHGCNEMADRNDFVALTRRINGGTNGLADRHERWAQAKSALGMQDGVA